MVYRTSEERSNAKTLLRCSCWFLLSKCLFLMVFAIREDRRLGRLKNSLGLEVNLEEKPAEMKAPGLTVAFQACSPSCRTQASILFTHVHALLDFSCQ
jgi:hypothetical protein